MGGLLGGLGHWGAQARRCSEAPVEVSKSCNSGAVSLRGHDRSEPEVHLLGAQDAQGQ